MKPSEATHLVALKQIYFFIYCLVVKSLVAESESERYPGDVQCSKNNKNNRTRGQNSPWVWQNCGSPSAWPNPGMQILGRHLVSVPRITQPVILSGFQFHSFLGVSTAWCPSSVEQTSWANQLYKQLSATWNTQKDTTSPHTDTQNLWSTLKKSYLQDTTGPSYPLPSICRIDTPLCLPMVLIDNLIKP